MKKLLYLLSAVALMAGVTACEGNNNEGPTPNGPIAFDGFYIYGEAVGTQEFLAVNQMAAGSNEVTKSLREGMFEKYIWLEGGKDFSLVENKAGNKVFYGAELAEVNYGFDADDPTCKNFADNPNMKIQAGKMIIGADAPAMQVPTTGMYHIVLDNNAQGDLEYPQIIIQPAEWGVRGGMNGWGFTPGERTINADGSVTYAWKDQNLAKGGEFKFGSCHGWKINLDVDGAVKAEVSLGLTDGKLHNAAKDNIKVEKAGLYDLTLTWKPAAGAVADAFSYEVILTQESTLPETMYIIGNDFGNWTWEDAGVVEMVPVHSNPGKFWAVRYMTTTTEFKFCAQKAWNGEFTGLKDNTGYITPNNCQVEADGLYLIIVDLNGDAVSVAPAKIYGIGDAFGSWDAATYPFEVAADGTATITTAKAGNLRMYVPASNEWWHAEFNIYDGKIAFRAGGNDQEAVAVQAGQTVTLNFNAGTGSIQ